MKIKSVVFSLLLILIQFNSLAQCPMCRSAVESSMNSGGPKSVGMGLNTGILFLLVTVYAAMFSIALLWYINFRKNKLKHEQAS